jgi:hypothetical protein
MKKLINDPFDAVDEMVEGFVAAHADVVRLVGEAVEVALRVGDEVRVRQEVADPASVVAAVIQVDRRDDLCVVIDLVSVPVVLRRDWSPGFGSRAVHDGWLGFGF